MKAVEFLRQLGDRVTALETKLMGLEGERQAPPDVATDAELDHPQYGDPVVKKDPPRCPPALAGQHVGKRFSACPAEYLDVVAGFCDWRAGKAENEKKAGFARLDARRARGWAKRVRAKGWDDD